jgi:hypothetical protein
VLSLQLALTPVRHMQLCASACLVAGRRSCALCNCRLAPGRPPGSTLAAHRSAVRWSGWQQRAALAVVQQSQPGLDCSLPLTLRICGASLARSAAQLTDMCVTAAAVMLS